MEGLIPDDVVGKHSPHDDSSIADVDNAIAPSQMSWKGTSPGQSQMILSNPPTPLVYIAYSWCFPVPDAMEGHVAYISNIMQYIGCTFPYSYPDILEGNVEDVLLAAVSQLLLPEIN